MKQIIISKINKKYKIMKTLSIPDKIQENSPKGFGMHLSFMEQFDSEQLPATSCLNDFFFSILNL